jgi:hypothetical protein
MYENIVLYDLQVMLGLLEAIAWTGVIAVFLIFLIQLKSKVLTKQLKRTIWVIFAIWAVTNVGIATLSVVSYFSSRQNINQSIESQQ